MLNFPEFVLPCRACAAACLVVSDSLLLLPLLSCFSHVQLCATPKTAAHQAPLSLGFSRQEHWSGLPCPAPGDLPDPGFKPAPLASLHWQADFLPLCHLESLRIIMVVFLKHI